MPNGLTEHARRQERRQGGAGMSAIRRRHTPRQNQGQNHHKPECLHDRSLLYEKAKAASFLALLDVGQPDLVDKASALHAAPALLLQ
jgi:hypothetical protein